MKMKREISIELPKIRLDWRMDKGLNKEGKVALNFFIRYDGKTIKKATGCTIKPKQWNNEKKLIVGKSRDLDRIRTRLSERMQEFDEYCLKYDVMRGRISWKEVDLFFEDTRTECFFPFADKFVENAKIDWAESTLTKHLSNLKIFREFCKTRKLSEPTFLDVNSQLVSDFRSYLLKVRGMQKASLNNYDKTMRIILKSAKKEKLIDEYPYDYIECEKLDKAPEIETLDANEIMKIANVEIPENKSHLKRAKEYFVFMLNTGVRFCDFATIRSTDFRERKSEDDPKKRSCFLHLRQKKTDRKVIVPMNLVARRIFVKYKIISQKNGSEYVFGDLINQSMNKELKELAKLAGIPKRVYCHLARHSFATNLRDLGVSLMDISDLLGHADMRMTKRYAKPSESRLLDAVKLLDATSPEKIQLN